MQIASFTNADNTTILLTECGPDRFEVTFHRHDRETACRIHDSLGLAARDYLATIANEIAAWTENEDEYIAIDGLVK